MASQGNTPSFNGHHFNPSFDFGVDEPMPTQRLLPDSRVPADYEHYLAEANRLGGKDGHPFMYNGHLFFNGVPYVPSYLAMMGNMQNGGYPHYS